MAPAKGDRLAEKISYGYFGPRNKTHRCNGIAPLQSPPASGNSQNSRIPLRK